MTNCLNSFLLRGVVFETPISVINEKGQRKTTIRLELDTIFEVVTYNTMGRLLATYCDENLKSGMLVEVVGILGDGRCLEARSVDLLDTQAQTKNNSAAPNGVRMMKSEGGI